MIDMYVTSGMVQSSLTRSYLNYEKKKGFKEVITEMYEKENYVTIKPNLSKELSLSDLSEDKFLDLLYELPIHINNIIKVISNTEIGEADILPENSDIFVFKHFNYIDNHIHSHNYFEICYIFKGSCNLQFEKEQRTLVEGDLCIVAPTSSHDVIVDNENSIVITISIRKSTFDSAFFTLLSQKDLLSYFFRTILYNQTSSNYLLFHTDNSNDLKMIIKNLIMENYKGDIYYNNCSISWANILFSNILRNYSETIQFYNYNMDNDFSLILQYIQHNYRDLSLKTLAEHFHYSEAHLSTLIKKNVGLNFVALITKLKMSDAKDYLMNTNLSIEKIAEYIGYNNVDHFSRTFKKYYNNSPQQYRKSLL
ncbi:bifunctional transcriptional activator/DNA repair enzyme AdaA [Clostridium puniceum]|uniref:Bifunctional transcriptional activator/DNA repair enzyme AdaA n=1 Tax=Clostridium puniceum TaxID=29367 RepID=A0A1S8TEB3_9CLOT|nr:AraC family transcriptional regulator [Clostridium puniceum]OOM76046.1 bifunctional transcriptional activator/DNA repair enzyme AdaA [Clostridium puniceum]